MFFHHMIGEHDFFNHPSVSVSKGNHCLDGINYKVAKHNVRKDLEKWAEKTGAKMYTGTCEEHGFKNCTSFKGARDITIQTCSK
jgi:flavin-dependent dehydrogenase